MCFILSDLKGYESATSSFKNHLWSAKENEQWINNNKINKFSDLQNIYLFFLWTPPTFKVHKFFNSDSF
jgi:hypothetical protein